MTLSAIQLPYIQIEPWVWLPAGSFGGVLPMSVGLQPFGVLTALGMGLGTWLCLRSASALSIPRKEILDFILWILLGGFVGAHLLDVLLYTPSRVRSDPWVLLRLWDGMSSLGGFLGGVVAAVAWSNRRRRPFLPFADLVASVLPVSLALGRAGCALAHDHPGVPNQTFLAMPFPDAQRLDMGLLEMVLLLPQVAFTLYFRRRRHPWGFFGALFCVAYPPLRFALDFFRAHTGPFADVRYCGLTPAQWLCIPLFLGGLVLLVRVNGQRAEPDAFAMPRVRRA